MTSWSACQFWFPGSGAEFALYHSIEALDIPQRPRTKPSTVLSLQHRQRTPTSPEFDDSGIFGTSISQFSEPNQQVLSYLRDGVKEAKKERGSYPDFEAKFLAAMEVQDKASLSKATMSFDDFKRCAAALDMDEIFENMGGDATMKGFFQECCMLKPIIQPAPKLEHNAFDVLMNFVKAVTGPIHALQWVKLEDLAWVLDPDFKSPMSMWRTQYTEIFNKVR